MFVYVFHDSSRTYSGCIDAWILWSCAFMYYDPGLPLKRVWFSGSGTETIGGRLGAAAGAGEWANWVKQENSPTVPRPQLVFGYYHDEYQFSRMLFVACRLIHALIQWYMSCLYYDIWFSEYFLVHLGQWQDSGGKVLSIQCKKISTLESCDYGVPVR